MNEAWQRTGLADFSRDAGLKDFEEYFLQSIVRLADTSGVLANNALAVRTASFTVPWASSVLTAYKSGQLWQAHVQRAVLSALAACEDLVQIDRLNLPSVQRWGTILSACLPLSSLGANPLTISPQEVEQHHFEVASLVLSGAGQSSLTFDQLDLLAAEIAVGFISRAASLGDFIHELGNLNPSEAEFRPKLVSLILRPGKLFHVIVPVGGARKLEGIETLTTSAQLRQVGPTKRGSFSGWGQAAPGAHDFADEYYRTLNYPRIDPAFQKQRILVAATLTACDKHSAAVAARRVVGEALDNYVAEHPFVHFQVDDTMGVVRADKSRVETVSLGFPTEPLSKPTKVTRSDSLRQAMRVHHLLRDATAPMTRIALAWVMVESSGLRTQNIDSIAKTLALTSLRQAAFMPYRFIVQDAMDRQRVKNYRRHAEYRRRSARRWHLRAMKPDLPRLAVDINERAAVRAEILAGLNELLATRADQESMIKRNALTELDTTVNPAVDLSAGHRAYLPSEAAWLTVIRANWETSTDPVAKALRNLIDGVSLPAKVAVKTLSEMTRSGAKTADLLSVKKDWLADILNAFYAARNMNLHSGIFGSEGDLSLGEAALVISDSLFETWGNWYSNEPGPPSDSAQVILGLADRFDRCMRYLSAGGSVMDMDIDRLTAPDWVPAGAV